MAADCLFCRLARGELGADLLHQDGTCVAVADIAPQAPVHLLVLPRRHLASTADADPGLEALSGHLVAVAAGLARARGLDATGYRLVFNVGRHALNSVPHLHMHVLGGQQMGWPPGVEPIA